MTLDLFRGVVPFVAVAEAGSFRQAARALGVTAAAVSKAVLALEADLGVTLLERTNRVVALTREGELFFERCRQAASSVQGAREAVEAARREPTGELVISAPFVVMPLLPPALALLRARYPLLTYRLKITDAISKLAEESVDVAVRVGALAPSALVARRLKATQMVTVAAPSYVARRGTPRSAADLDAHDCLVLLGPGQKPFPWLLSSGPHAVNGTVVTDHGPALVEAARRGLGVAQAFDFLVADALAAGALVQVLSDLTAAGPDIHAVCTPGRRASPRVKAAFHALSDAFSGQRT